MDKNREVYDAFALALDRSDLQKGGSRFVRVKDVVAIGTPMASEVEILATLSQWERAAFIGRNDADQPLTINAEVFLTPDGEVFFKSKYRV